MSSQALEHVALQLQACSQDSGTKLIAKIYGLWAKGKQAKQSLALEDTNPHRRQ